MINMATGEHIEHTADLAEKFYEQQGLPGKFNRDHFCNTWAGLISNNVGFVIQRTSHGQVAEAIGVLCHEDPYTGVKMATTNFWFYNKDIPTTGLEGGLLKEKLEEELKMMGVKRVYLALLENERKAKIADMLIKDGYSPAEQVLRKDL